MEKQLAARVRQLENSSDGGAPDGHDDGGGALASGSSDPDELTELEATIKNAQADLDYAKQRLGKETSEHHRRVHQQRAEYATESLNTAKARKDHLRQVNLDPQAKQLEVIRKGNALKKQLKAEEAQLRKAVDHLAEAKQGMGDATNKYRETQAAIRANQLQHEECLRQQVPKTPDEQLQGLFHVVEATAQEAAAKATDPHQQAALAAMAPSMVAFKEMVGRLQASFAQIAAMEAGAVATQAAAPAAPAPQQPPPPLDGAPVPKQPPQPPLVVNQAQSACPAENAGLQVGQPTATKQAGTGTTCSPTKATPKAATAAARRKPPSEECNIEAILEMGDECLGSRPRQDAASGGEPNTPSPKRSRASKEADDANGMDDEGDEDEQEAWM